MCRVFRNTCTSFSVQYVCNFLGYRSIWYMNESSHSRKICVRVFIMWTHLQCEILWPHGLLNELQNSQLCHATCYLWPLQQQLQFLFATPEQSVCWCDTHNLWGSPKGNTHGYSCPVNMVARRPPISPEVLWKLILQDTATKHIQNVQDNMLYAVMHHPAGKMLYPHALLPE